MISGRIVSLENSFIKVRSCSILMVILNWLLIFISGIFSRLRLLLSHIFLAKLFTIFILKSSIENVDHDPYTDFFLTYEPVEVDIDEYYNNCSYSDLDNS